MAELRDGTDIRIKYDEDGEGWMDPYTWWLLDCLWRYSATNELADSPKHQPSP